MDFALKPRKSWCAMIERDQRKPNVEKLIYQKIYYKPSLNL